MSKMTHRSASSHLLPITNASASSSQNAVSSTAAAMPMAPPTGGQDSILLWDLSRVVSWLHSVGLGALERSFVDSDITGDVLVRLSDDLLTDMAITKVGTRLAVLKAIHTLKCTHGIPYEPGDYVPFFANQISTTPQNLPQPLEWPKSSDEARKTLEVFKCYVDAVTILSKDVQRLSRDLLRLKDELCPAMSMNKEYQSILERERRLKQMSSGASIKSSSSIRRESPTSARAVTPVSSTKSPLEDTSTVFRTVKVYGDRLAGRENDGYKSFKLGLDDTCSSFLPMALRKYKILEDWQNYALFVVGQGGVPAERCLGYDECPLIAYNEIAAISSFGQSTRSRDSAEPFFVLRHIKQVNLPIARVDVYQTNSAEATGSSFRGPDFGSPNQIQAGLSSFNGLSRVASARQAHSSTTSKPSTTQQQDSLGTGRRVSHGNLNAQSLSASSLSSSNAGALTSLKRSSVSASHLSEKITQNSSALASLSFPPPAENSRAVAVYEYATQRSDELPLIIGDEVIIRNRSTGWCIVEKRDETGWVPAGCLVEESTAEEFQRVEGVGLVYGDALFDYEKIGPNELTIRKGESLRLKKKYQHWLLAECNGRSGWVPSCYVSIDQSKERSKSFTEEPPRVSSQSPSASTNIEQRNGSNFHRKGSSSSVASKSLANCSGSVLTKRVDVVANDLMAQVRLFAESSRRDPDYDTEMPTKLQGLSSGSITGDLKSSIGQATNLLTVLAQLPSSSANYAFVAEKLETLLERVLREVVGFDEVLLLLTELVAAMAEQRDPAVLMRTSSVMTEKAGESPFVSKPLSLNSTYSSSGAPQISINLGTPLRMSTSLPFPAAAGGVTPSISSPNTRTDDNYGFQRLK